MKSTCIANVILLLFLVESDLLIFRVNSFIASYSCGVRASKGPFRVAELFVSTNYNNKDDSRGGNKPSNSNLKQLIAKIAQTEQDLEQRLMKLARTEKDLLAQIAVKEQELEQQSQRKPSSQGTNSRIFFSSQMNGSRLKVDDVLDTTTIDVPIGGGSSGSARTTSMPFNRPKSRDNSSSNAREPSLDFSEDVRKSIITGYFIYAIGLGSTLALQAAIQAYPEEWASFVTKTQTTVQSATAPITTAAATLQDLIDDTLSSTRDGVSNSVESTTNAILDTLQAGASMVESTRTTLDMTKERAADNVEATANAVLDKLKQGLNLLEENDILQQKAPLTPANRIATHENVMRNEAEVALDSLRAAEGSVANEIMGTGRSVYENSGTTELEPPTRNELKMITNLADDVGTSVTSSAEVQSRVESVYEEVNPIAAVAPTFSNDYFETKFTEENVKKDVNPVAAVSPTLSMDNLEVKKDVNPIAAVAPTLSDDNLQLKVMEEGVSREVNSKAAVTPSLSKENLEMKFMEESVDKVVNPMAAVAPTLPKDNLEVKFMEESVDKEVNPIAAVTLSNDNLEMKVMEETATNTLPQQETGSAFAPTEKQSTPALLQQNVKEDLLVELPSPISSIISSDNSLANKENAMKFSSQSTSDTFDANNKGEIAVVAAKESIINVAEPSKFDDTQPPLMIQTKTAPEDALREAAVNTFLEALLAGEVSPDSLAKVDSAIDLYLQHLRQ